MEISKNSPKEENAKTEESLEKPQKTWLPQISVAPMLDGTNLKYIILFYNIIYFPVGNM